MDQKYIIENLARFKAAAGDKIEDCRLERLFPGYELSSPYVLKILAPWTKDVSSFEGYRTLYEILWQAVTEPFRSKIFLLDVAETPEAYAQPFQSPAAYESPLG